ncbi:hypothetical protein [Streptomyces liangshanensis]
MTNGARKPQGLPQEGAGFHAYMDIGWAFEGGYGGRWLVRAWG